MADNVQILTFNEGAQNYEVFNPFNYDSPKPKYGMDSLNLKGREDLLLWFKEDNNYPKKTLEAIRTGTTLQSVLNELDIYYTGSGLLSDNAEVNKYIENEKNINLESLHDVFGQSVHSYNRLANSFVKIVRGANETGERSGVLTFENMPADKCRLAKNGTQVWVRSDWQNDSQKQKTQKYSTYPNFKKRSRNGIVFFESVLHIKNTVLGFDHYGIVEYMKEALLLNEKEHRRNNWQLSQLKKGFKKDFLVVGEFGSIKKKEVERISEEIKKSSGDDNAGGLYQMTAKNGKLEPLQADFKFDFEKDDTAQQLYRLTGFPCSLVGIKTAAAFSPEEIENDYDQFRPKILKNQKDILKYFDKVFLNELGWDSGLRVKNDPPAVTLQNYMQHMNEEQKTKVMNLVLERYGIE